MRGDRDHELIGLYFRLVPEHLHKKFQPSMMPGGLSIPYLINHFFGRDTGGAPSIKVISKVREFLTLHLSISVARQVGLITFSIICLATDRIAAALFSRASKKHPRPPYKTGATCTWVGGLRVNTQPIQSNISKISTGSITLSTNFSLLAIIEHINNQVVPLHAKIQV